MLNQYNNQDYQKKIVARDVRTYSGEFLIKLLTSCLFYFPTAVGEPPLCMSCACLFALKHAVEEARAEIGKGDEYFVMSE